MAERLWTGIDYTDTFPMVNDFIRRRIEEHTCRMRHNGIPAEPPNGPGFCIGPGSRHDIISRTISRRKRRRNSHCKLKANNTRYANIRTNTYYLS